MATRILMILLGLTLAVAVACGTAAPEPTAVPDPTATQVADAAPAAEPTAAPVESATSQPTATPQMAAPPAEVEVNPGTVTWMIGSFGNERFDYTFNTAGHDYARQVHGFGAVDQRPALDGDGTAYGVDARVEQYGW